MLISLHKQATTTPKIRAAIQASSEPAWRVAERYGISEQTVWKWRGRDDVHDRSHTPHRLQTTLTPARSRPSRLHSARPCSCRSTTCSRWCASSSTRMSRARELDRCLRRHGAGNLRALKIAMSDRSILSLPGE